jgi:hypothetical protein
MNLDDAKQAWHAGTGPTDEELAARLVTVRTRADTFESNLKRRDWTESGAALFVMVAFLPMLFGFKQPLVRAGALVIIAHAAGIVMVLWMVRRTHIDPPADAPLIEHLRSRHTNVLRQMRLLGAAPWWYVAPSLVGQLMVCAGLSESWLAALIPGSICLAVCVAVGWINVRASRTGLVPLRDELWSAIMDLEAGERRG